jgi:FKBP-type peptidyl-prolyl cis-trans isomerase (trigger factor)
MDMYLSRLNKSRDDMKQQWQSEAERQVRMSLVVRQVVKEQNIAAQADEVEATMQEAMTRLTEQGGPTQDSLDADALRRTIEDRLVTEKALVYLEQTYSHAKA